MYQNYKYIENLNTWLWVGALLSSPNRTPYAWFKPANIKMCYFICIGSGGSGGGGGASTVATAGGGGGGGSSGSICKLLLPAYAVPSILFISPGDARLGGAGQTQGGAAHNGAGGVNSTVAVLRGAAANGLNNLCLAGGGGAGLGGNGSTAGTGGSGPVAITSDLIAIGCSGLFHSIAGKNGTAGGSGAAGTDITPLSASFISGGAGGGGVDATTNTFAGGNILTSSFFPQINGGVSLGGAGTTGYDFFGHLGLRDMPICSSGGSGGGGDTLVATGGDGGHGGIGSGGGGGGGTNGVSSIGGTGGNSGPGAIIITCW